jgi:hypothetical protein
MEDVSVQGQGWNQKKEQMLEAI